MPSIIDATDGWLTDWSEQGGRFKEWVRGIELTSINHGYLYAMYRQPIIWWESICNIVSWIPFLWDDRDWDHAYLLNMMQEKLRRMRIHQEKCGHSTSSAEIAKQILVAELLLKRIIANDYVMADYAEHEKKFGSIFDRREKLPDGSAITRPSRDPEESKDVRRMADKEAYMSKQDLEYFGRHFAKHVRGWWD